jgi:serine phosphatase RsbU (regulator of sigma subunit)/PAS domain-containing protein
MNAASEAMRDHGFCFPALAAIVVEAKGAVLRWSPEAERLLRRPADAVCGRPFRDLLADVPADGATGEPARGTPQDDPGGPAPHGPASGVPASGVPTAGAVLLRDGAGDTVDADLWTVPLEGAADECLLLLAPASRTEEWGRGVSLLRAILDQRTTGLVLHAADLALELTNITPDMYGGPAVEPGDRLGQVISAEDATDIEGVLSAVLRTGEPVVAHRQRMRSPLVPGREWTLSMSVFRMNDAGGEPTGVAVVLDDVTEQERIRRHRELLHHAADLIGFSLDMRRTAQALADVVVSGLADLATVDLAQPVLDGDEPSEVRRGRTSLIRVATASAAAPWPAHLMGVGERYPLLPESPELRLLVTGHSVVQDRTSVERALGGGPLVDLLVPPDAHSLAVAPLFARGLLLGSVTAWRTARPERFDTEEGELLGEITSRAALGIDNARRYTREHRSAVALQQRLLPRAVISTSAAQTAGVYRPAGGGAGVGGDWFDVITLPSLRLACVVGDVIGHGLSAAAAMGRLRTAVQTIAELELDADEVLVRVEDLVLRLAAETQPEQRDAVGATCLYAVYDPVSCQCTFASAGQPPPVLVLPDGGTRLLEVSPGPPLGVGGVPYQSTTVDVAPGSVLAFYTDGLLEVERYSGPDGLGLLCQDLAALCRSNQDLDAVGGELLAATEGQAPRDDIAVLLVRTRAVSPHRVSSWEFPAEPRSVAEARAAAAARVTSWGLDQLAFATELVVSELVTNAIRYAGGPVKVRLIRDEVLICEVTDPSNTQPRLLRATSTDEGGRGLYIVAQCTTRWGCRYGRRGKTIWTEQPLLDGEREPAVAGAR